MRTADCDYAVSGSVREAMPSIDDLLGCIAADFSSSELSIFDEYT